jgi:4-hydroxybenzoate polyprenyltransferase
MIFEKLGDKIDQLPELLRKPLMTCPICMASVYGFPIYWGYYLINSTNLILAIITYICYTFALAGFNYIITAIISK